MPLSKDTKLNETAEALKEALKGAFHTPPGYRPGVTAFKDICDERFS